MRGERRVEHLDRLEPEGLDSFEQPLAGPEQDGGHVEREFVDHSGGERLRTVEGPPAMSMPSSPAVSRASAYAASKPWVTKWKLVPPSISIGSRAWWVSTKTGAW